MNIEDHPGYTQALHFNATPMTIMKTWLAALHAREGVMFFDMSGQYRGTVQSNGHHSTVAETWQGRRFTPEELHTLFALEQLHR